MRIWLSKPFYEALPYFYMIAGLACLLAALYLDQWYWPTICLVSGFVCLIGGLVILLKRRDFRHDERPSDHGGPDSR